MTRDGAVYVIQGVRLSLTFNTGAPMPYTGSPQFVMADTGNAIPDSTAILLCLVDLLDGNTK